jgi:DNA-binding transcriptional LysR family regulator
VDWNDLRYFLGVARSGGLTRTASDLRVSQSTVSRRISEFEASLGMTPFARHQTGYFLTDAGSEVLRHAETVEESILALERSATGLDKAPAGTVRLSTSESLATDLIIPAMPGTARRQMNAHGGGALVAGSAASTRMRLLRPGGRAAREQSAAMGALTKWI